MIYKTTIIILVVGFSALAMAADVELVPYGSPPLLNGIDGDKEWSHPGVMEWEWKTVLVRFKQDSFFVYLNVLDRDTLHSGIDLYLDNMSGNIMIFHVSSAHGERQLRDSVWSEMTFGPPQLWSSNIVENVFEDGRMKFISPESFEFQIDKSQLPSRTFKLMVHLKRPDKWVPPDADTLSSSSWIKVELRR